jgi:hypothetical protein
MAACKCSPCGREFTGLSAFDRHQDVDYGRRPAVQCKDPATLGLVQNGHGRWGSPATDASRLWVEKMRAERGAPGGAAYPQDPKPAESSLEPSP